jgi:hypothetical protein
MGHIIAGFIARTETLREAAPRWPGARVIPLAQGLGFLPLTEELSEPMPADDPNTLFDYLSAELADFGRELSALAPVAYVETQYYGGLGRQCALAWHDGDVVAGPERAPIGPINVALRAIGVVCEGELDEFDSVHLGWFRCNEEWLAHAEGE